jgi:hypothetical protein
MPITVKELNISTTVNGNSTSGNNKPAAGTGGGGGGKLDKEVIIREAVRRVMEELSYKMGR